MAFTVYGPGIRDNVTLDNLFERRVVEQATAADPVRKISDENAEPGNDAFRQHLARQEARKAYQETAQIRERAPALHAHQIMTVPVLTLTPDTTIVAAWKVFRERRFRHIPVVQGRVIVGIISDRDLLRYAALSGKIPPYGDDAPEARTSIQGLMKTKVLTASPDTEIRQIARILFEQRIGAMPVVEDDGRLVGIITRSDILRTLINHAPLELWV